MKPITIIASLLLSMGGLVFAQPGEVSMGEPRTYPRAGLSLALPDSFAPQSLENQFLLVRALEESQGQIVRNVALSVFPEVDTEAGKLADRMTAELERDLAYREVKVRKKVAMPVAKLEGTARVLTYTYRGRKMVSVRVHFVRPIDGRDYSLAYVLSVTSAIEGDDALGGSLRVLEGVIKSVKLTPIRRPGEMAMPKLANRWVHHSLSFAIRQPAGWFAVPTDSGVAMGQMDYLARPVPMPSPSASVVVREVDQGASCLRMVEKLKNSYRRGAIRGKYEVEIVSESEQSLGSAKGRQLVLRKLYRPKARADGSREDQVSPAPEAYHELLIVRIVCVRRDDDAPPRSYSLVLTGQEISADRGEKLMNRLAESFAFVTAGDAEDASGGASDAEGSTGARSGEPAGVPNPSEVGRSDPNVADGATDADEDS
jgi:hypothetical protein